MSKINTFRDIQVWGKAHQLVLMVYKYTKGFPREERYGVVDQMRRASVSCAANIVEGFNRRSVKDSLHFYNISHASLEETKYFLLVSLDLSFLTHADYEAMMNHANEVGAMLRSWTNSQVSNTKR